MGDRVIQVDGATLDLRGALEVGGEPDGLARTDVLPKAVCHACNPRPGAASPPP
jgi:hypothetical protein